MNSSALPIGTLVENPAALGAPCPPLMKRMCARCELVLGWIVCVPSKAGGISHSACPACIEVQLEELEDWQANRAALALAVEYTLDVTPSPHGERTF